MIVPVRLYQWVISPFMGPACRFYPTCSRYAAEALQTHGPIKGSWLAARRLLRCHPWGGYGVDLVPPSVVKPPSEILCDKGHDCERHSQT